MGTEVKIARQLLILESCLYLISTHTYIYVTFQNMPRSIQFNGITQNDHMHKHLYHYDFHLLKTLVLEAPST